MARKKKEDHAPHSATSSAEFDLVEKIVGGQPVLVKVYRSQPAELIDEKRVPDYVPTDRLRVSFGYRD